MIDEHNAKSVTAADIEEIRDLFLRQAAGETAHDIQVIESVLARTPPGHPDPVNFVARAYRFWGREAVIDHFRSLFSGIWRFEPDEDAIRILPLGPDVAHIYAPHTHHRRCGRPGGGDLHILGERIRDPDRRRLAHFGHRSRAGAVIGIADMHHRSSHR